MRISDWSSDVCSSDLDLAGARGAAREANAAWRRPAANPHHRLRRDRRRDPAHDPPLDRRRLGDKLCARPAVALAGAAARPLQRAVSWHPPASLRLQRSGRSEEHTSELQSLMRISYAVFCLKKKHKKHTTNYMLTNMTS